MSDRESIIVGHNNNSNFVVVGISKSLLRTQERLDGASGYKPVSPDLRLANREAAHTSTSNPHAK